MTTNHTTGHPDGTTRAQPVLAEQAREIQAFGGATSEMMDCMVSYFSFNGNSEGVPYRYYCYLVVAGPGPTDEAGVATITALAVHEGDRPCDSCANWFFAPRGGPEAAMGRALLYLDAYHDGHRLRRVTSQVRRTPGR